MFDAFFSKGFKAAKCKTLLKLSMPRIKLLRNKREVQIKQMRKDIAKLLETGQEATARIRVEHVIREENMMAAQEIIELFCELISVRLPIIETQRECPLDLKEAISSVCFAAPRCADLPELQQVQVLFAMKYGKEFVSAATELVPNCGVNRQLIELLSVRAPSPEAKLKLLKEITEEHQLDWDPAASETEFFKPHEDLLNGPTQFVSGSKLPLPEEKHTGPSLYSDESSKMDSSFEEGFNLADFPEVPNVPLNTNTEPILTPEVTEVVSPSSPSITIQEQSDITERTAPAHEGTGELTGSLEKQSPPFINTKSEMKGQDSLDLQDVLAAAQTAAESAERAAVAARSAASLAEVKISEFIKNKHERALESAYSNPFHSSADSMSPSKVDSDEGHGGNFPFDEGHGVNFPFDEGQGSNLQFDEGQGGNFAFDHGQGSNLVFDEGQGGNLPFDQGQGGNVLFNEGHGGNLPFDQGQGGNLTFDHGRGSNLVFEGQGGNLPFDEGHGGNLDIDRVCEHCHTTETSSYEMGGATSQYQEGHRLSEYGYVERSSSMEDDSYFSYPNLFKSEGLEVGPSHRVNLEHDHLSHK